MAKGAIRDKKPDMVDQFRFVDDGLVKRTLIGMADRYDERIRNIIYRTYNDLKLHDIYRRTRASGVHQHRKDNRKIIEFPNNYVYDFVNTIMSHRHGDDWMSNKKAINDELVRCWWVVDRI